MQILIVVNLFAPDFAGGASLYTDLSRELAARGHDVTVRTGYPYFPEWTDKSGQNGWRIRRSSEHGVRLERHGMYLPNPASAKERAVYELSFFLSLLRSFFRGRSPDAILGRCLSIYQAVTFGGLAFGAWIWGALADLADARTAMLGAGAFLLVTMVLSRQFAPMPARHEGRADL